MSEDATIFSAKYRFIFDDVFLIARVDKISGKQWLVMQKIDPRTNFVLMEDRIQCIHTAITTIDLADFQDTVSDEGFQESVLYLRSSEGVNPIELSIEDQIFAFKSWVEGIANAGTNAITIQEDIERFASLHTPISRPIFNFLLKAKTEFIVHFLEKIKKDSIYEGEYHKPSINANLMKLLEVIALEGKQAWNRWRDQVNVNYTWSDEWNLYLINNFDTIMQKIYELQPSANIFLEDEKYHFILMLPESRDFLTDYSEVTRDSVFYMNKLRKCYKDKDSGLLALDLSCIKLESLDQVDGLERLDHLEQLHLEVNHLPRLEALGMFPRLKRLYANHNYIKKLENLDDSPELEVLYIGYNPIKKIEGLDGLTNLRELYLFNSEIEKIECLEALDNLEVLSLSWCKIHQIAGLENLVNLKWLNLGGNQIERVEGLECLAQLESLDLFSNKLTYNPDLSYLPHLTHFNIDDNPIQTKKP